MELIARHFPRKEKVRRMGKQSDWEKIEDVVKKTEELGLTYVEGAKKFGIGVGKIYEFNRREKRLSQREETERGSKEQTVNKDKSSLPDEVIQLILEYRRNHPTHGFKNELNYFVW